MTIASSSASIYYYRRDGLTHPIFCLLSETLTDVANTFVHMLLQIPGYGDITKIPETSLGLPHTLYRLTHIECYMDEVITSVQGGMEQQHQIFGGTVRSLKWLFLSFPR